MANDRAHGPVALTAAVAAALSLCACGRVGPELVPPSAAGTTPAPASSTAATANPGATTTAATTANADAVKNGFDAQGNPVAPPGQKQSFPLDPLLR